MNTDNQTTKEQLQTGRAALNALVQQEYGEDLASVLADPNPTRRSLRIGRLLGVLLKEPFATARSIDPQDPNLTLTGAHQAWDLDENAFSIPEKQTTWQYQVLESLREEQGWPPTVLEFAQGLQYERAFFAQLAISTRKYICGDLAIRQRIDAEVNRSGQGAFQLLSIGTASTQLATLLVNSVPWLTGVTGAESFISGLSLLIGLIGIDAFCDWSASLVHMNLE